MNKYFAGHWVLCCLQCASLKVSFLELWIILLCSYSTPSTPFFSFLILHFHLRGSQASLTWCVSSAGPCPGKSGWEGALLSCFPSHPHWLLPPLHGISPVVLQLFSGLRLSKKELKKFSISRCWLLMSLSGALLVRGCAQGMAGSHVWPSLKHGQDRHHWPRPRTWPGDQRGGQPSAHPKPGVLAQITTPLAVTRDQGCLALRLTLHESIHQHQDETHFLALLILQATQKALPKVP